jgi:ribonuclease HII
MIELDERDLEILNKTENLVFVSGTDESGAGNWAGNLIVASVILNKNNPIAGLNDSKKLTSKKREELFDEIIEKALDYSIIEITPEEIDNSNILAMRMEGMKRSIEALNRVDYALIDGNKLPEGLNMPNDYLIKGDGKVESIAAASILAKITIDKQMKIHNNNYPHYGFITNKGYGTKVHREALEKHGVCEIHRMSYKPVRASMTDEQFEKWKSRTK